MQRIEFETGAVASLRRRVAEVEEINEELAAFARGHAGAVNAIHEAVLAAMAATTREELAEVLTVEWPLLLRVDMVALVWIAEGEAWRADQDGLKPVERRIAAKFVDTLRPVTIRSVDRGHPLFGERAETVRSEALIRLDGYSGTGAILIGQSVGTPTDGRHGIRLLSFLGASVSHMLERWPVP
jgi:uncharacterized protein